MRVEACPRGQMSRGLLSEGRMMSCLRSTACCDNDNTGWFPTAARCTSMNLWDNLDKPPPPDQKDGSLHQKRINNSSSFAMVRE